jgi:hypothetical protein
VRDGFAGASLVYEQRGVTDANVGVFRRQSQSALEVSECLCGRAVLGLPPADGVVRCCGAFGITAVVNLLKVIGIGLAIAKQRGRLTTGERGVAEHFGDGLRRRSDDGGTTFLDALNQTSGNDKGVIADVVLDLGCGLADCVGIDALTVLENNRLSRGGGKASGDQEDDKGPHEGAF